MSYFFIYDRDYKSYKHNELRGKYIRRYVDPYANEEGYQGQLLLSYPAVESYLLACIQDDVYQQKYYLGTDIKPKIVKFDFLENDISEEKHITHAVTEMDKGLSVFNLENYDLDNLGSTLLTVYEEQQKSVEKCGMFSALSLISMALLELGVIIECDDTEESMELEV